MRGRKKGFQTAPHLHTKLTSYLSGPDKQRHPGARLQTKFQIKEYLFTKESTKKNPSYKEQKENAVKKSSN